MNKVEFERTVEIYLEFGTGDKPPNSSEQTPADKERQEEILRDMASGATVRMIRPTGM